MNRSVYQLSPPRTHTKPFVYEYESLQRVVKTEREGGGRAGNGGRGRESGQWREGEGEWAMEGGVGRAKVA